MKIKKKSDSSMDQCFGLGDYAQIDEAFKNYCSESSQFFLQMKIKKEETQLKPNSKRQTQIQTQKLKENLISFRSFQSVVISKMRAHRNFQNERSKSNSRPQKMSFQFIEDKIKNFVSNFWRRRQQKSKINTEVDNISFLTKKYGNFLSSSLIDSLVLETIKFQYGKNSNQIDLMGTTQKLLKQFNISIDYLAQLKSPEEKKSYVKKQFDTTINDLLKEWKNKIVQKERKINKQDAEFIKNINQKQEADQDVFEWLNLKTKYEKLRRKLRVQLMDQLNDYENEMKLLEAMEKKKVGIFSKKKDSVELNGIKQIYTSEIIQRINSNEKALQQKNQKNFNTHQDQSLDSTICKEITWNDNLEKKFQKERKNAKFNYFQLISSSNFNSLAFYPFLQEVRLEDPTDVQRELKLAKYQNGDWLTAQEMKFLANTSKLLNSCVDKNLVQKTVQIISPTSIDQLEANLAEEIIENHEKLVNQLQKARIEYIRNKILHKKQEILKIAQEEMKKQKTKSLQLQKNKKLRQYQVLCRNYFSNLSIKDKVKNNVYADMFVRKILKKLKDYRDRHPKQQSNYESQNLINTARSRQEQEQKLKRLSNYRISSTSPVKSLYHPSSKLSLFKKLEQEDQPSYMDLQDRKEKFAKIQQIHQQRLITNSSKDKLSFVKFYSNGPNVPNRKEPIYNRQTNKFKSLKQDELNSIILIQSWFRRYICVKRYKDLKEQFQLKKYRNYYHRLEQKYTTQKFYELVDTVRKTIAVPSNIDILEENKNLIKIPETDKSAIFNRHIRLHTNTSENDFHSTLNDSKSRSRIVDQKMQQRKQHKRNQVLSASSKQNSILTNKSLIFTQKQVNLSNQIIRIPKKQLLVKHQRLIKNAKIGCLQGVLKSGFKYNMEDIDIQDEQGNTPLYYAAEANNIEFVKYLIQYGANPNLLCKDNTPLHQAFKSQNIDIIMEMIINGGDLNVLNQQKQTPLIYGCPQVMRSLNLTDGVCSVENIQDLNSNIICSLNFQDFDNNKLLTLKKFYEIFSD